VTEQTNNRSTADWLVELCVYAPIGFVLDAHKYVPEFVDRGRSQVALARFLGKFALDRIEQRLGPLGSVLRSPSAAGSAPPQRAAEPATPPVDVDTIETADVAGPGGSLDAPLPTPAPSGQNGADHTERSARSRPRPERPRTAAPSPASPEGDPPTASRPAPRRPRAPRSTPPGATTSTAKAAGRRPRAAGSSVRPGGRSSDQRPSGELPIEGYATLAASQIVPRLTTLSATDLAAVARYERANRGRRTILNRVEQLLAER
jgi:hypothetical protein